MKMIIIPHILFVEDDETLAFVTADSLRPRGFQVSHFSDGSEALKAFKENKYDLCLLDVMLPGMDGFSLAEEIRKLDDQIPVLFLTARTMQEDRIHGLSIGGDDYISKPFSIEELVLRMKVFLKRQGLQETAAGKDNGIYVLGDYILDHQNLILKGKASEQRLTMTEAELLKLFFTNNNKVLKREDILIAVWGDDSSYLSRSLDVFISRLRKFLSGDKSISLKNMRSVGFILRR
jgi:two-component system response regulator VicR